MTNVASTGRWWGEPAWRWSLLSVGAITVLAVVVGFVWLPSASATASVGGLWASICRAAGVPQPRWGESATTAGVTTTHVVLVAAMARPSSADAAGHGATLALQRCGMCHGAQGIARADAPSLAGQHPEVFAKQLADYRRGDRSSSVMQAMAGGLSDADVAGLAAYYTALPAKAPPDATGMATAPPALVRSGDAMRNIAPCASCHGGMGTKLGAPALDGLAKNYLAAQLAAFASGARHNDSHAQMRNMARRLSSTEIDALAGFYAGR